MRHSRIAAFLLAVLCVVGKLASEPPAPPPDQARLQGDWEIVSVQRYGVTDAQHVGARLNFAGSVVTFQQRIIDFANLDLSKVDLSSATSYKIDETALAKMTFG